MSVDYGMHCRISLFHKCTTLWTRHHNSSHENCFDDDSSSNYEPSFDSDDDISDIFSSDVYFSSDDDVSWIFFSSSICFDSDSSIDSSFVSDVFDDDFESDVFDVVFSDEDVSLVDDSDFVFKSKSVCCLFRRSSFLKRRNKQNSLTIFQSGFYTFGV